MDNNSIDPKCNVLPDHPIIIQPYYSGKQFYLHFKLQEWEAVQRCQQQHTASCQVLGLPLLQTKSREPLDAAL